MNDVQVECHNIGEDDDDDDDDDDDYDDTPLSLYFNRPTVNKLCVQEDAFCVTKARTQFMYY